MVLQVSGSDRRCNLGEVCGDRVGQLALVKALEALSSETLQRRAERRQLHDIAFGWRLTVRHEGFGEIRLVFQFCEFLGGEFGLTARDDDAVLSVIDRAFQQAFARQRRLPMLRDVQRLLPAGDGAGDGIGGERPAERDRRSALRGIISEIHRRAGAAAGIHRGRRLARLGDQPKAVTANTGHVRIDNRKRSRHGDRRLHGGAAVLEHIETGLRRQVMRRGHHAPSRARCFKHSSSPECLARQHIFEASRSEFDR